MKKIIYITLLFIIIVVLFVSKEVKSFVIPSDAIRLRVVANSNTTEDQAVKMVVKNRVEKDVYNLLSGIDNYKEAKDILADNLNSIEDGVSKILNSNKIDYGYSLNFGQNYFPTKEYKGVKYEEGYYESLLVTLGDGKGENWWCVLFPPLCLLEAEENEKIDEVEYKFFVEELFNKIFKH